MKKQGYRTESRTRIMAYLRENRDRTVTVRDIAAHLENEAEPVHITTIYRYLDQLERDGALLKYTGEQGRQAAYQYVQPEQDCGAHLHLQCVSCGRILHLDCAFMDEIAAHIEKEHNFALQCAGSVLYGLCDACRPDLRAHQKRRRAQGE